MTKPKWTLEWTSKFYDGHTELSYPLEYWNGGFMMWGKTPSDRFLFDTEEELKEFISKALWDKNDPSNKTFRIVQYTPNWQYCDSIVGRSAVGYGWEYFDIDDGRCDCPHECEYKLVIKPNEGEVNEKKSTGEIRNE